MKNVKRTIQTATKSESQFIPAHIPQDFEFSVQEKTLKGFASKSLIVKAVGNKIDIRSGIIAAMVADENFASYITDAAEYFKTFKK
jgi:hypothetical protein